MNHDDFDFVNENLRNLEIHFPFFLDKEGEFKKENSIPDDPKYQTFLLDKEDKIIWIGSPIRNKKSWDLFNKMMLSL